MGGWDPRGRRTFKHKKVHLSEKEQKYSAGAPTCRKYRDAQGAGAWGPNGVQRFRRTGLCLHGQDPPVRRSCFTFAPLTPPSPTSPRSSTASPHTHLLPPSGSELRAAGPQPEVSPLARRGCCGAGRGIQNFGDSGSSSLLVLSFPAIREIHSGNKIVITGCLWGQIKQFYTNDWNLKKDLRTLGVIILQCFFKGVKLPVDASQLYPDFLLQMPWREPACVDCDPHPCPPPALWALGPDYCKGLLDSARDSV